MAFALGAGDLFQLDSGGEFEETIISKCVDQYVAYSADRHGAPAAAAASKSLATSFTPAEDNDHAKLTSATTPFSQSQAASKSLLSRQNTENLADYPATDIQPGALDSDAIISDPKTIKALETIIERLFEACLKAGRYRQVVGIAIESRNLEIVRRVIKRARDDEAASGENSASQELMEYILSISMDVVQERGLRTQILKLILEVLQELPEPDYFAIAKCVVYLNEHEMAGEILKKLVAMDDIHEMARAYQVAFDLHDNGTQHFLAEVVKHLPVPSEEKQPSQDENAPENQGLLDDKDDNSRLTEEESGKYYNIRAILDGTLTIRMNLEFLYANNHADVAILNKVRDSLEPRNSIFHTAVTICNGFMNQGTTNDKFFRDNLEWLGKAINWSKFSATASLGVIHRGNFGVAKKLLGPYLPNGGGSGSTYSQGGALYAYGLIYANHGAEAIEYLTKSFTDATDEVVLHGAALGLGLAGMATGDESILEKLKQTLYTDSAINGEAVGLSMGLIMLGTGKLNALEEMIQYAHETQHEKIVRGLALGMSMIMFGRQEMADDLIEGLLSDADPTLRYGGIMTIAMAYAGTGSNKAVRKLLHVAVSDVNDDVRRIAVMCLGFILFRKPSSVPRMVELLSESYNPHVRYGAAMALGISCAGTGLDEAIDLLEPMMKDPTDFVRQGALMALAMIMIQQNEVMNPKVTMVRATLKKILTDRHEDAMTKFGCSLAMGIIDAGGRNCTIGLQTPSGNLNMPAIIGMAVFTQYWYWFPFSHFLSMAFTPTALVALDHDLDVPQFNAFCSTRKALWEYPPKEEKKGEVKVEEVKTAVLSTTAQARRRAMKKKRSGSVGAMDIDSQAGKEGTPVPVTPKVDATIPEAMEVDESAPAEKKDEEKEGNSNKDDTAADATPNGKSAASKKNGDKSGFEVPNMARVLPAQLKYVTFPGNRYKPVRTPATGGFVLLIDKDPDGEKELVELKVRKLEEAATAAAARGERVMGDGPGAARDGLGGRAGLGGRGMGTLEREFLRRGGDPRELARLADITGGRRVPRDIFGEVGGAAGSTPGVRTDRERRLSADMEELMERERERQAGGRREGSAVEEEVGEIDGEGWESEVPGLFGYDLEDEKNEGSDEEL